MRKRGTICLLSGLKCKSNITAFTPQNRRFLPGVFDAKPLTTRSAGGGAWFTHLSAERAAERVRASRRRQSGDALGVRVAVGADRSEEVCGDGELLGGLARLRAHRAAGACKQSYVSPLNYFSFSRLKWIGFKSGSPNLFLKGSSPAGSPALPALLPGDYLDQVCPVNGKTEQEIKEIKGICFLH